MDPTRWRYLVEGGEHAIFEETVSSSNSIHKLLRIRKRDLAISDQIDAGGADYDTEETDGSKPQSYLETVVAPLLTPYVDVPVTIQLEWSFLKNLKRQTIAKGCIPDSRKSDWSLEQSKMNGVGMGFTKVSKHVDAQLVPDYRKLPVTPRDSPYALVPSTVLSVELKPKAGYVAFSPLVQPKNRIKYQHSRYVLKQQLYQLKHQEIRSGWFSGLVQQSLYDPLDLYSGNTKRIQKAVRELFRCPQNNLRITCNNQLLLSKGEDGSPVYSDNAGVLCKDILSNWIRADDGDTRLTLEEHICSWLVDVFQQEEVLQRLERWQKLDIVDADGAILLYDRLVELCEGSHEKAQSLLDNIETSTEMQTNSPLISSPFSWSPCSEFDNMLPRFCQQVKDFESILLEAAAVLPPEDLLDHHRKEMVKMIESLQIPECQYLLWNWLLSLTLNDVSMFVTFQRVSPKNCDHDVLGSTQLATCSDHGVLKLPLKDKGHQVFLAYTIRIVDCDGKPSKKLRTRRKKEEPFALLSQSNKDC